MENSIWGEYCGIDIGYWFNELQGNEDCLVLSVCNDGTQIDTEFIKREDLVLDNYSPRPFGCWKIKK